MFGKYALIIIVLFTHAAFARDAGSNNAVTSETRYRVSLTAADAVQVTARFVPDGTLLYMFHGAHQFPKRWAEFIDDLQLTDAAGHVVELIDNEDGSWQIGAAVPGPVTLTYTLQLEHENHSWSGGIDGVAYRRDWGVFLTGRALFIANGRERRNIRVDFELPASWAVTTAWQKTDVETNFIAADLDSLAGAMMFAGTHQHTEIQSGDFELRLALGGEAIIANGDAYADLATSALDYYTELMGGIPRLVSTDGISRSAVIISQNDSTDGEAVGNNISLLVNPDGGPMSGMIAQLLLVHEFFHLWNGKSIVPADDSTEWFKEGFSNYYTLKALHQGGHLDDEGFLAVLANLFYARYAGDDGVGRLSMTDGEQKHAHWGLIYSGGLFVAIIQDLLIREATDNEKSVDDLMRDFFARFDGRNYTIDDIRDALGQLSDQDQSGFFDDFVVGVESLPLAEYLQLAGIALVAGDGAPTFVISPDSTARQDAIRRGMFGQGTAF